MKLILFSFAAGLIAGLLVAPDSGRNTRRRIVKSVNDVHEFVNEKIELAESKIEDTAEQVDSKLQRFAS